MLQGCSPFGWSPSGGALVGIGSTFKECALWGDRWWASTYLRGGAISGRFVPQNGENGPRI